MPETSSTELHPPHESTIDESDVDDAFFFQDPSFEETEVLIPWDENPPATQSFSQDTFNLWEIKRICIGFNTRIFLDRLYTCIPNEDICNHDRMCRKINVDIQRTPVYWDEQRLTDPEQIRRNLASMGFRNPRWWLLAAGGATANMLEQMRDRFGLVQHVSGDSKMVRTWNRFDVVRENSRKNIKWSCSAVFQVVDPEDVEIVLGPHFRVVQTFVFGDETGVVTIMPEH